MAETAAENTGKPDAGLEGLRLEYELLRGEIRSHDQISLFISGFLLTATATLAGIAVDRTPEIAWIISPIWFVGYFYLSEKRFMIMKVANYLKTEVEPRCPGLNWETWHSASVEEGHNQPTPALFLRWDPYLLETISSCIVIFGNPLFVAWVEDWDPQAAGIWLTLLVAVIFYAAARRAMKAYISLLPQKDLSYLQPTSWLSFIFLLRIDGEPKRQ